MVLDNTARPGARNLDILRKCARLAHYGRRDAALPSRTRFYLFIEAAVGLGRLG